MKVYCVPSHHSIKPNPAHEQGVLLTLKMLEKGIWFIGGGNTHSTEQKYVSEVSYYRSKNEAEYMAALKALLKIHSDNQHFRAVVSMRWCSLTYRLVTAKRVWLTIFYAERAWCAYSHKPGDHATHNFCECWAGEAELDQKAWEGRFNNDINLADAHDSV